MIEKTKLSLWDFFVMVLSGFAIVLSVLIHCLLKGVITWKLIFNSSSVLQVTASLLIIILLGLLFEPLANYITKLLTTCPCKYKKLFCFKEWDKSNKALEKKATQNVPKEIKTSTYQYCKNWVTQNTSDDSYMPYLAKYGFYRSISILLFVNSASIPFLYQIGWINMVIIMLVILAFASIYFYRSRVFYRHISVTIYSRFIASFETK